MKTTAEQEASPDFWADDWQEADYYGDFEMPEQEAVSDDSLGYIWSRWSDPENGDNDAYEIFY